MSMMTLREASTTSRRKFTLISLGDSLTFYDFSSDRQLKSVLKDVKKLQSSTSRKRYFGYTDDTLKISEFEKKIQTALSTLQVSALFFTGRDELRAHFLGIPLAGRLVSSKRHRRQHRPHGPGDEADPNHGRSYAQQYQGGSDCKRKKRPAYLYVD
jgi:hypothetical protein